LVRARELDSDQIIESHEMSAPAGREHGNIGDNAPHFYILTVVARRSKAK
jgi:hypothetical protein